MNNKHLDTANQLLTTALLALSIRLLIYRILLVVLPGGRTLPLIAPMLLNLAALIALLEWLEHSLRKNPGPRHHTAALTLWALAAAAAIGIIPLKNALTKTNKQYVPAGNRTYTFRPGIQFSQQIPGSPQTITYKTGPHGHRECPSTTNNTQNTIRLIGDSFIFGLHIDTPDTLCSTLGRELATRGLQPNITNEGISGLSLHSYLNIISAHPSPKHTWLIIGYLSRNDFAPYDTFFELNAIRHSTPYRAAALLLGPDTLTKALNWYNNRIVNRDPPPEWYTRHDTELKALTAHNRIIIITYLGDDTFITHIQQKFPEITIVHLDLRPTPQNIQNRLIIPGDGHPTGKANRIIARKLADIISNKTTDCPPTEHTVPITGQPCISFCQFVQLNFRIPIVHPMGTPLKLTHAHATTPAREAARHARSTENQSLPLLFSRRRRHENRTRKTPVHPCNTWPCHYVERQENAWRNQYRR